MAKNIVVTFPNHWHQVMLRLEEDDATPEDAMKELRELLSTRPDHGFFCEGPQDNLVGAKSIKDGGVYEWAEIGQ